MSITPEYIAGFFDGEGCITARPVNGRSIHIHISIGQKDSSILTLIKEFFGYGIIGKRGPSDSNPRRDIWRYRITKTELVLDFLQKINSHLVIKRGQSELAIEFIEHQLKTKWKHQSKEEKEYREQTAIKIKELKEKT